MTEAHLSDERLAELGIAWSGTPKNGEKAHLESCAACARRLAAERRLTALLSRIPVDPPDASFAASARARFERETRATTVRHAIFALACLAVAAGVWMLVAWVGSDAIAVELAKIVTAGAAVFRASSALAAASPIGAAICVGIAAVALVVVSGALAALFSGQRNVRAPAGARVKEVS